MDFKEFYDTSADVKKKVVLHKTPISFSLLEPPPLVWLKKHEEIDIPGKNNCLAINMYEKIKVEENYSDRDKNEGLKIEIEQSRKSEEVINKIFMSMGVPLISKIKPEIKAEVFEIESMPPYSSLESEDHKSYLQELVVKDNSQCIADKPLHDPLANDGKGVGSNNNVSGVIEMFSDTTKQLVKIEQIDLEQVFYDVNFCEIKKEQLHQEFDMKMDDLVPHENSILASQAQLTVRTVSKRHRSHIHVFNKRKLRKQENCKFQCDQCDYETLQKRYLQSHILRHQSSEGNTFKCDQCNHKRIPKQYLKLHILRHKDPKEVNMFKCDQCGHKTIEKRYFQWHMIRHESSEKVNILKCDQCEYQSIYKSTYKRHLLRHRNPVGVNMFKSK